MKLDIPPSQVGGNCDQCKHFIPSEVKRYHVTPQGLIPAPDLFSITHPKEQWADVGPCTFTPTWGSCPTNHWCAHFSPRTLSS